MVEATVEELFPFWWRKWVWVAGGALKDPSAGEVDEEVEGDFRLQPDGDDARQQARQKRATRKIKNAEGRDAPEP
jgi:hypothetical protein